MKIVYSPLHNEHNPPFEFRRGEKIAAYEIPDRVTNILETLQQRSFGEFIEPDGLEVPLLKVHDEVYIQFLKEIYPRWKEAQLDGDLVPYCWPGSGKMEDMPQEIFGQLGFFGGDADTPILEGTWTAAYAAASCAATAARFVGHQQERVVFSLSRPPGHHAGRRRYAGYCFLNHAAVACEVLLESGMGSVALLDIDYHHGDGSQAIFEDRPDVLFVSLHADPDMEYPFFSGRVDETGIGAGIGYTINYPLPLGTAWEEYRLTLEKGLADIQVYQPDALVISLGLDISERDLLGKFRLADEIFDRIGAMCASLELPTVIILEGGYAISYVGDLVYRFLRGFEEGMILNKGM